MRSFGAVLVLAGILGFVYASSQLDAVPPLPQGLSVRESLSLPAGRWQIARYGFAAAAGVGLLMALMPKGR